MEEGRRKLGRISALHGPHPLPTWRSSFQFESLWDSVFCLNKESCFPYILSKINT